MFKSLRSAEIAHVKRLEVILVRAMVDPWPKWWPKNFILKPVQPVRTDKSIN